MSSQDYGGEDPRVLAKQAEWDLGTKEAKTGHQGSDTSRSSPGSASERNSCDAVSDVLLVLEHVSIS
jgi:hypothetical protein